MVHEIFVALAEVAIAEETTIGTERTGMRTAQHQVPTLVDERCLAACWCTPQEEHEMVAARAEQADDFVGERLPTLPTMAEGLMLSHGEAGVEQEHPLPGPACQVATHGDGGTRLGLYLLKDITQGRRKFHAIIDTETQSMSLTYPMIGILTQDDHLDLIEGSAVESIKDELARRKAET